jgi:hypothetical protein
MNHRNVIAALAIVALLIIAATIAGCTSSTNPSPLPTQIPATQATVGNDTTFSSAAGFNITFPKNLAMDRNGTENASQPVRVYIYLNPNNKTDGVVVATQSLSSGQKLSDFVDYNVGELKNYNSTGVYKNFTILNETNSTIGGKPAHTIVWSGVVPVQISQTTPINTSVKMMQTLVVNNNTWYVITYKTISSDYDTYLAQAQRIMNSFLLT